MFGSQMTKKPKTVSELSKYARRPRAKALSAEGRSDTPVLINYATYARKVDIHCIAADA
jgi:hypothetical protein